MRPVKILAALSLIATGVALLAASNALADDNPVAVGPNYFCDASKVGQICQTDIQVGDSVTWTVEAGAGSHTVTQCTDSSFSSCGSGFESGVVMAGATFTQSFPSAGTSYYYCAFHPSLMRGAVVVQAATPTPSAAPTSAAPTTTSGGTASPTGAALPSAGGEPGNSLTIPVVILLAGGAALILAGGLSLAVARRRSD